jgi:hypothetical protein
MSNGEGGWKYEGYKLRKFKLPEKDAQGESLENNSKVASWYFLNIIDFTSAIDGVMAHEDIENMQDAKIFTLDT